MAIYVYRCSKCEKELEINKPMSEVNREETCDCGNKLIRVYSGYTNTIKYNSSGFYSTDYNNRKIV